MCVGQVFFWLLTIHSHYDYCRIWLWILLILQTISIYNYRLPMKVMLLVVAVCLSTGGGEFHVYASNLVSTYLYRIPALTKYRQGTSPCLKTCSTSASPSPYSLTYSNLFSLVSLYSNSLSCTCSKFFNIKY